jgi:hypothetical protein
MKICDLIKHLADEVSAHGDHELKIHVLRYGDDLTSEYVEICGICYDENLGIFVAEIEVYGFES